MKIERLEELLTLAKQHGATDITFWDSGFHDYDISDGADTTFPMSNIAVRMKKDNRTYCLELDRTDKDENWLYGRSGGR